MLMFIFVWCFGCGVKGDPVPPSRPPDLGWGKPSYRNATQKIRVRQVSPSDSSAQDNEPSDEEGIEQ